MPGLSQYVDLFQFTPLREGRLIKGLGGAEETYFNSRPSARGDSQTDCIRENLANFNSRPSARGDSSSAQDAPEYVFQFTPLREGRPVGGGAVYIHYISIHAPPRGATLWLKGLPPLHPFQFTPLREGRHNEYDFGTLRFYFNSRPSARGDLFLLLLFLLRPSPFQFTPLREGRRWRP